MKAGLVVAAALAAIGCYFLWRNPGSLNPLSTNNVVNKAADATVSTLTGGQYLSLGGLLFGETPAEQSINAPVTQADIDAYRAGRGAQTAAPAPADPLDTLTPFLAGA